MTKKLKREIEKLPKNQQEQALIAIKTWNKTRNLNDIAIAIRPKNRRYMAWFRYYPNGSSQRGITDVLAEEIPALWRRVHKNLLTCVIDTESAKWQRTKHVTEAIEKRSQQWREVFKTYEKFGYFKTPPSSNFMSIGKI